MGDASTLFDKGQGKRRERTRGRLHCNAHADQIGFMLRRNGHNSEIQKKTTTVVTANGDVQTKEHLNLNFQVKTVRNTVMPCAGQRSDSHIRPRMDREFCTEQKIRSYCSRRIVFLNLELKFVFDVVTARLIENFSGSNKTTK